MILDTDTCNLCFSEPNKDLPPSSLDFLKVTLSFLLLVVIVETPLSIGSSSLMSSNVRYSENGLDWNDFLSLWGILLSNAKFAEVS